MHRKIAVTITVVVVSVAVSAQSQVGSLTPVLIGSTGNYSTSSSISISSSTGECMVPTFQASPFILTQGFQQPTAAGTLALNATVIFSNVSCLGANDGTANVTTFGGSAPYTYTWSTGSGDSLSTNDSLTPGTYTVTVTDAGNLSVTNTFTIVEGGDICGIHVYSGFTPNGDNHNDLWIIDYIDLHMPNTVTIYNRWGYQVWYGENYDNVNVVWDGKDSNGDVLPDATYYFVLTADSAVMKNWVEITH